MTARPDTLLDVEIAFERQIAKSKDLSLFRRNATTWELLLLLAAEPEGFTEGLHRMSEVMTTRHLGTSALLKFIRERRDAGQIDFVEHQKRNKWILKLEPALIAELQGLLSERNRAITEVICKDATARA